MYMCIECAASCAAWCKDMWVWVDKGTWENTVTGKTFVYEEKATEKGERRRTSCVPEGNGDCRRAVGGAAAASTTIAPSIANATWRRYRARQRLARLFVVLSERFF